MPSLISLSFFSSSCIALLCAQVGSANRTVAIVALAGCWLATVPAGANELPDRTGDALRQSDAADPNRPDLEPLVPRQLRSEAEGDRLEALQLYAAGRVKEQKEQLPAALRFYERAYRRDPQAVAVLKQIIPLAFNLGRAEEAFRYALKLGEADPSDPVLLRQLGVHLTGEGRLDEALHFYERAWEVERKRDSKAPNVVLLLAQLGKLYLVQDQTAKAAEVYGEIVKALAQPDTYRLDRRTRKLVFDDAAKTLDLLGIDLEGSDDEQAAYELFGRALFQAGKLDEAQAAYAQAEKIRPSESLAAWHQAQMASARGEKEAALKALDAYFQAKATSHDEAPYELLEKLITDTGQPSEVLGRLQQVLDSDPKNEPLKLFLSQRYRRAGDWGKARPLLDELAESEPSLDVYRGQIEVAHRLRDIPVLTRTLARVLAQVQLVDLLGEPGQALLADSALVDELLSSARKQLADKPEELSPEARAALGTFALAAKRFDAARALFEGAIQSDVEKVGEIRRQWGLGLLMQDQEADAAAIFALEPEGETPAARAQRLYHLAGALELTGKTEEALAAAREARELAEANIEKLGGTYYALVMRTAWILFHAQRYDAARDAYTALLIRFDSQQDSKGARSAAREARLMLSNVAAIQNDMPQAEEWLEQILDEVPDDVSAANDLGYIWADQGKHLERSLRMIQYAVAESPENGAYRDSLGWTWYRLGKFDEAIAELTKATELLDEPDGVIFDHLGDALQKAGRAADAKAAWEKGVAAFEQENEPEKARLTREKIASQPSQSP